MALSPFRRTEDRMVVVKPRVAPSRTYKLNLGTKENEKVELEERIIDGEEALRQFIHKAILTPRFRYLIYNDQYGCEVQELLGQDLAFELLKSEVSRYIKEALIYDDRIMDVRNFEISRDGSKVFVTFSVMTKTGALILEVNL